MTLALTKSNRAEISHTPITHHVPRSRSDHTNVSGSAAGNVTHHDFFSRTPSHAATDLIQ